MERVREIGAGAAPAGDAAVDAARQALLREIAREERTDAASTRHRRARWIGGSALVGGLAAAAFVVASVIVPPQQAVPSAAAAEVLEQAAEMTVTAVDTRVEPGQYLRIETVTEWLQLWHADWSDDTDVNTIAFNWGDRATADAAVLVRDARATYVPADRAEDWFYDWGTVEIIRGFGARAGDAAAEWEDYPGARRSDEGVERLPAGEFLAPEADTPPMPYLVDSYRPYYDEMPRDPEALLDWLRARSGLDAHEVDDWIVASFEDPLTVNLMPADLRAATFRALALVPGMEVAEKEGDLVTLERHATVNDRRWFVIVDTAAGYIQSTWTDYGQGGVAGETPSSRFSVSMSVVDEAPEPIPSP